MTLGTSNYPLPPPRVAHHSVTSLSAKYQILHAGKRHILLRFPTQQCHWLQGTELGTKVFIQSG